MNRVSLSRRGLLKTAGAGAGLALASSFATPVRRAAAADAKLVLLTHYNTDQELKVLKPLFDEYTKENPGVTIEHQTVAYADLLNRITASRLGGAPDIYSYYTLWLADFVDSQLFATPPADAVSGIKASYPAGTVGGVTYQGQVWGYPTEVDDYQLIYNKKLLQEAGVEQPPATWDELKSTALKATKKNSKGKITQPGFLLLTNWDSGATHPFTSLLWSNGGEYNAPDNSKVLFNQTPGVQALQLEDDLVTSGACDLSFTMNDMAVGKVAMTIMANWWGSTLATSLPGGIANAGVAPIPTTPGHKSVALQYTWAFGVSKNTQHADEAWAFLKWMNSPNQKYNGSSPMGLFLTTALNVIPSLTSDQKAHAQLLNTPFYKPFVDALATSRSESVIPSAQEIKTDLENQIQASWFGKASATDALNKAAQQADAILSKKS